MRLDAPPRWAVGLLALGILGTCLVVPSLVRSWVRFQPITIGAADPGNQIYEAKAIECPTCASGRRVRYLGQGHTLVVPVRDVTVAGRRTLTVFYESDGVRELYVGVGNQKPVLLSLAGRGSWTAPAHTTLTIELPAGDTDLKFFHPSLPTPDLDQIRIS